MEVGKKKGKKKYKFSSFSKNWFRQAENERHDEAHKRAPNEHQKSRIFIEEASTEENLKMCFYFDFCKIQNSIKREVESIETPLTNRQEAASSFSRSMKWPLVS